ncbi:MAG: GAF domain-containing protein, partial [Janthinobacterium lividum]
MAETASTSVPAFIPGSPDDVCAREPIHVPGAIQPHGLLLAAAPAPDRAAPGQAGLGLATGALAIVVASANASLLLGRDPLGCSLASVLGEEVARELVERDLAGELSPQSPWETTIELPGLGVAFELAAHRHDGLLLLELERAAPDDAARALLAGRLLQRWIGRLRESGGGIDALAELATRGIRQITGYERVLVYRFDPDWHGQAIAEDKVADWAQSFNGLHFPASDIPRQARELYCVSLMRWVPNRDYVPVPLCTYPGLGTGPAPTSPLDLSFARLRSLSPVHLQYHRNMGVNGTMSLSVLRDGRLWGLVVCHHRAPHRISPGQRAATAAL